MRPNKTVCLCQNFYYIQVFAGFFSHSSMVPLSQVSKYLVKTLADNFIRPRHSASDETLSYRQCVSLCTGFHTILFKKYSCWSFVLCLWNQSLKKWPFKNHYTSLCSVIIPNALWLTSLIFHYTIGDGIRSRWWGKKLLLNAII